MEKSCPPCHHVVFLKIWDPLLFLLILLLCSVFILCQTCVQLSRSKRGFRCPGWEVSRGRGCLIEASSVYLAVRASHKAQTAATTVDNWSPCWQLLLVKIQAWTCRTKKRRLSSQQINKVRKTCKTNVKLPRRTFDNFLGHNKHLTTTWPTESCDNVHL